MASYKRIRIDYSDGVRDFVPANQSSELPSGSSFDYYRIPDEDDAKYTRWLKTLGAFLKSETSLKDTPEEYTLSAFPENYTFLEHCKSQGEGKKHRTDVYLFGHPAGGRFRSINEFMPHLLWLAKDRDHVPTNCTCKLCPSGSAPNGARSRAGKAKPVFTGMSEIGKLQLAKAQADMRADLSRFAPVYRVGEIVLYQDAPHLVGEAKTAGEPKDLLEALSLHTYTLFECDAPYEQVTDVPSASIMPYLSRDTTDDSDLAVVHAASPIAKYNITQSAHLPSALPGPCYAAWMLGPEKIYQNDVVRLSAATSTRDVGEVMLLSHILLDVATQTVKVRGDIFELCDPAAHPVAVEQDERAVPEAIEQICRALARRPRCVGTPGLEFDLDLAEVHGRYYLPQVYDGAVSSARVTKIERGRAAALPEGLVAKVAALFEATDSADSSTVQLGVRAGAVVPTSHSTSDPTTTKDPAGQSTGQTDTITNEALGSPAAAEEVAPPLQSAVGDTERQTDITEDQRHKRPAESPLGSATTKVQIVRDF